MVGVSSIVDSIAPLGVAPTPGGSNSSTDIRRLSAVSLKGNGRFVESIAGDVATGPTPGGNRVETSTGGGASPDAGGGDEGTGFTGAGIEGTGAFVGAGAVVAALSLAGGANPGGYIFPLPAGAGLLRTGTVFGASLSGGVSTGGPWAAGDSFGLLGTVAGAPLPGGENPGGYNDVVGAFAVAGFGTFVGGAGAGTGFTGAGLVGFTGAAGPKPGG
jgi:hypothetical protein